MAWRCGSCRPIATCSPFPIANACHQAGTLNKKRTAHRRCTGGDFPPLVGCSQTVAAAAVVAARSGPRPLARARDQTILCQGRSTVTSRACGSAGKTMWAKQMLLAPDAPIPRADRLRERGKPRKPVVPGPSATRQACDAHLISVLETGLAGRPGIGAGRAPQVATLVRCQYFHIGHHYQQCRPMSRGFR